METIKLARVYIFSISLLAFLIIFALKTGIVEGAPSFTDASNLADSIIRIVTQIRLPRVIMATGIGMGLAVSGAVLQVLFSNPFCEPYTLGISSGAVIGILIGIALGVEWRVGGLVGTALVGSFAFCAFLSLSYYRVRQNRFLVFGSLMGAFCLSGSLIGLNTSHAHGFQSSLFWMGGDLSQARLKGSLLVFLANLWLTFLIWIDRQDLDGLLLGSDGASELGVNIIAVRQKMILRVALMVGLCVAGGGAIGFIGLCIPLWVRRWVGCFHLHLIPLSAVWGASTLILFDCGARTWIAPAELPLGLLTATLGIPLLFWEISPQGHRHGV